MRLTRAVHCEKEIFQYKNVYWIYRNGYLTSEVTFGFGNKTRIVWEWFPNSTEIIIELKNEK